MIFFRRFNYLEANTLLRNVIKRHKSNERPLPAGSVTDNEQRSENYFSRGKKVPKYLRIAKEEQLNLNDIHTKTQELEEVENIFKEIAQGDEKINSQLRLLLYEIMLKREEEENVPSQLFKENWECLLNLRSLSARNKYLFYLYKTEKKKESQKIKNLLKRKEMGSFEECLKKLPHIYYGLNGYSMFLRIYQQHLFTVQDVRALTNSLFASPILFDCSYQEYMNNLHSKFCAKQLAYAVRANRMHCYPCSLQLVNLNKDDVLMKFLKVFLPNFNEPDIGFLTNEKSYLDLYPKERLVYLTPHTKVELIDFNPNDIFIIGAYVDKGEGVQASLAKAKENNLRMAKLPIDRFCLWRKGTKSLTLNNVLNILLDMRFYRNWKVALKNLPARSLHDY